MRSKRYTVEQIVAKLREAEKLHESLRGELGSGLEILRSALLQRNAPHAPRSGIRPPMSRRQGEK
jgi:hypothetical protein